MIRANELFLNRLTTPNGSPLFYTEPADGIHNGAKRYPNTGGLMWENYSSPARCERKN